MSEDTHLAVATFLKTIRPPSLRLNWGTVVVAALLALAADAGGQQPSSFQPAEIWYGNQRIGSRPSSAADQAHQKTARQMLEAARRRAAAGDIEVARQMARWAAEVPIQWPSEGDSPKKLLQELRQYPQPPSGPHPRGSGDATTNIFSPTQPELTAAAEGSEPAADAAGQPPTPAELAEALQSPLLRSPEVAQQTKIAASAEPLPTPPADERVRSDTNPTQVAAEPSPGETKVGSKTAPSALATESVTGTTRWLGDASILPVAAFVAGFALCCLIGLVTLLVILNRLRSSGDALFRVEMVGPHSAAPAAAPAPYPAAGPPNPPYGFPGSGDGGGGDSPAGPASRGPAKPVDLKSVELASGPFPFVNPGPTFEEQKQQRDREQRERELAMLDEIVDQNVKLKTAMESL